MPPQVVAKAVKAHPTVVQPEPVAVPHHHFLFDVGALVVVFVLGVVLSQKVKDYIKGVPTQVRTALDEVEAATLAKLKATAVVVPSSPVQSPAAPAVAPPNPPSA
jgi:hypothetical protein